MSKSEINYINLTALNEEIAIKEEDVNFYGVVIDATFPYQTEKRYVMTCKVADPSTIEEKEYVNVVFLANELEQLPIIQRVGDILRVHRAQLHYFKDRKQIKVNMGFKSSWCLYTGSMKCPALEPKVIPENEDPNYFEYTPFNFSGKSFSQQEGEVKRLKKLRGYIEKFFQKHHLIKYEEMDSLKTLREEVQDGNEPKTFVEMVCKIEGMFDDGEAKTTLRLRDHKGGLWKSQIFKKKFPHLETGDIVVVKNAKAYYLREIAQPEIQFGQKGNILKFMKFSGELKNLKTLFKKLDAYRKCLTQLESGKRSPQFKKAVQEEPIALSEIFFNSEEVKEDLALTEFSLVGLKFEEDKEIVETVSSDPEINLGLIVKDAINEDDQRSYLFKVSDPVTFFNLSQDEIDSSSIKTAIEQKAKQLKLQYNDFIRALVQREENKYTLVHTRVQC